jgi:hypothetical protein
MASIPATDDIRSSAADGERRGAPRFDWKTPLNVQPGPSDLDGAPAVSAWSGNISSSGICFRCRSRLALGLIVLHPTGSREAVTFRLVRERQLCEGLWEYGATISQADELRVFQLPITEFQDLLTAFRVEQASHNEVVTPGHAASRDLVLSLREVTQDASQCIDRAYRWRRQRSYLRLLLWVALIAALAGFSIDRVATQFQRAWESMSKPFQTTAVDTDTRDPAR